MGREGSDSRNVRITLELLQARDERQLWSTTYDRVIDDIFEVQSDIADTGRATGWASHRPKGSAAGYRARPTANHEAYTLYLKGRYFWNKRTEGKHRDGAGLLPAGGGSRSRLFARLGRDRRRLDLSRVVQPAGATRGVPQGEGGRPEGAGVRQHARRKRTPRWGTSISSSTTTGMPRSASTGGRSSSSPGYPTAHHWYGGFLSAMGRHEEALQQAETARQLDPLSLIIQTWVGLRYYFARQNDSAIAEYLKALELDRDFAPAHWHLGWAYEQTGQVEKGVAEAERAVAIDQDNLLYVASLGSCVCRGGSGRSDARAILARLAQAAKERHVSAYHVAVIYIALGDLESGLTWLERAYDEQSPWIGYMRVDPRLDPVRGRPRFARLLGKAQLDF